MLFIWDGEMKADVDTGNLFHEVLGKAREGGCLNLRKAVGSLIAGRKRWGQKLPSTILHAITKREMIAPQQTLRCLNPLPLACNSLMRSSEFGRRTENSEEK